MREHQRRLAIAPCLPRIALAGETFMIAEGYRNRIRRLSQNQRSPSATCTEFRVRLTDSVDSSL
jgi:hypothetical protein